LTGRVSAQTSSVLAFREMGNGMAATHFESLTRTAATRLR
jgi:hypothetical protein